MDIEYFGRTYSRAKIEKHIDGKSALRVAEELVNLLFVKDDVSQHYDSHVDEKNDPSKLLGAMDD